MLHSFLGTVCPERLWSLLPGPAWTALWVSLVYQEDWIQWSPEVPSNPAVLWICDVHDRSMRLWFGAVVLCELFIYVVLLQNLAILTGLFFLELGNTFNCLYMHVHTLSSLLLKFGCKYSAFCILCCQFQLSHSSKFMKIPGASFEWAQDFKYWRCQPVETLIWIFVKAVSKMLLKPNKKKAPNKMKQNISGKYTTQRSRRVPVR